MVKLQNIITAVIVALVVTSTGYAAIMPEPALIAESQKTPLACAPDGLAYTDVPGPFADTNIFESFSLRHRPLPLVDAGVETNREMQPLLTTSDANSSLSLCLYALMGFGLCAAPRWLGRLSLGFVPEWYHDGGPFQIGHSHAATPESLCCAQVCFLAPPDDPADHLIPQYRLRIILSLWRKSQFTPTVLAARGPPFCS